MSCSTCGSCAFSKVMKANPIQLECYLNPPVSVQFHDPTFSEWRRPPVLPEDTCRNWTEEKHHQWDQE